MSGRELGQRRPKPEPKHWLEYGIFIFVIFTAIATGAAAWYTRQQWITAHNTLVVSERAFVYFNEPTVNRANDPIKGEFVSFNIPLINGGNTRTRNLKFTVRCPTSTTHLIEPWGLFRQEVVEHKPYVIPPKSTVYSYCGFLLSEIDAMSRGTLFGYIMGEVTYFDVFGEEQHLTQFSHALAFVHYEPNPFRLNIHSEATGQHDCADEDCPKD